MPVKITKNVKKVKTNHSKSMHILKNKRLKNRSCDMLWAASFQTKQISQNSTEIHV